MLRCAALSAVAALLAGCATVPAPRLYPEAQINTLTRSCGLALGQIYQEPDEPRILFLVAPAAAPAQVGCVGRWARKRNLHFAFLQSVSFGPE